MERTQPLLVVVGWPWPDSLQSRMGKGLHLAESRCPVCNQAHFMMAVRRKQGGWHSGHSTHRGVRSRSPRKQPGPPPALSEEPLLVSAQWSGILDTQQWDPSGRILHWSQV